MTQMDIDYYRRRAIQEQVAAQRAKCPTARRIHDELATMYRFRVAMLSDAWAEAGVSIALQRLSRNPVFPPMFNSENGRITAVELARLSGGHPGAEAVSMGG
jgi:hypothetical protein